MALILKDRVKETTTTAGNLGEERSYLTSCLNPIETFFRNNTANLTRRGYAGDGNNVFPRDIANFADCNGGNGGGRISAKWQAGERASAEPCL